MGAGLESRIRGLGSGLAPCFRWRKARPYPQCSEVVRGSDGARLDRDFAFASFLLSLESGFLPEIMS